MGSYASKLLARYGDEIPDQKTKQNSPEKLGPCTPINANKTLPIDPRSATVGIPRTPIEIIYTPPNAGRRPVSAIPLHLQKKPYLETDFDNIGLLAPRKGTPPILEDNVPASPVSGNQGPMNTEKLEIPSIDLTQVSPEEKISVENSTGDTPITELRYKILGIDPRSPAADFDRTPILAPKSMIRLKARSQENLARRDSLFELGLVEQSRLSYCEITTLGNVPEVLALPDIMAKLHKARDMDTTEEDSNEFDSFSSSSESSVETISESGEEITVIPNPNLKLTQEEEISNISNSCGSSIGKIDESGDIYYPINSVSRVLSIAAKAGDIKQSVSDVERKITVWRDSISPEIIDTLEFESSETRRDDFSLPKEEVIIEFDDSEIIKTFKMNATKKDEVIEEAKPKKQELPADRKNRNCETEGKIFLQEKIFTPERKNLNQGAKVRTPLGNRSNNHGKVSNMPMKSPQQLLRGKAMSTKLHQENTPPRSMKSKFNGTQWDPDSTVLI